jgi:hypothetical protein
MVRDINTELLECLRRDGFSHVGEAVGADHRQGTDGQRHASQSKSQG